MKEIYYLVYQGGMANVFLVNLNKHTGEQSTRQRILQSSFTHCEQFCRGLRQAKQEVKVAWCNRAGDIIDATWNESSFYNAPFDDSFAEDFIGIAKFTVGEPI